MKKLFKKMIALSLTFIFILHLAPVDAFAMANDDVNAALDFIESKGFLKENVLYSEKIEDGVKFTVNYLPSGEVSYLTYIKETNGEKLIISEGDKQNEIFFKDNGQVYLDGERNLNLESSSNSSGIAPRSTVAVSYYATFQEVPGYNYWSTKTFANVVNLDDEEISIFASMTVGAAAIAIAPAFTLPVGKAWLLYNTANLAITAVVGAKLSSAIMVVRASTQYIYNPTTLQYLYKYVGNSTILNKNLGDTFFKLESYN